MSAAAGWGATLKSTYGGAIRLLPTDHGVRFGPPMCELVDDRIDTALAQGGASRALRVLAAELFDLALICVQLRLAVARRPIPRSASRLLRSLGRPRRRYPDKSIAAAPPRYVRRPLRPWGLDARRRYRPAIGTFPFPAPLNAAPRPVRWPDS